jgi:DNA-binding transcriptional regulator YiaG
MQETSTPVAAISARLAVMHRLPPPELRRALREASGLSAAEVAGCLGVSRQTVAQWERGVRTPRGELLEHYVAVLERLALDSRSAS